MKIKKGDDVLLVSEDGHKYIVKVKEEVISMKDGQLDLGKLVNSKFGKSIKTHIGSEYSVLTPGFLDRLYKLKRGPQVILPKDAATIIAHTGLSTGAKVVDAGTGSGWLAAFLAHFVAPTGKVVSYEIRKDHHKLAKENIKSLGLKNIKLKLEDVTKGVKERGLDLITLDLLTPTKVPNISKALKVGGYCVAYVPHISQAEEFANFAKKQKMQIENIVEVREYGYEQKDTKIRRKKKILPHTGFIVFVRKVTS